MSAPRANTPANSTPGSVALVSCWNRIGVSGDQSCPELTEFIHCRNCPVFATGAGTFLDRPPPAGYLAEWRVELDEQCDASLDSREAVSLVIFRLGAEWLALRSAVVVEVTAVRPVHRIPHRSNAILTGLANLRGQLHLCASLHGLLDVAPEVPAENGSPAAEPRARMVVIRRRTESWVFPAEEVLAVPRVDPALFRSVPATHANPTVSYSEAVFTWDGRSVGLLDEDRLFDALGGLGQ